jgi:type I restriction enzyme S subunit
MNRVNLGNVCDFQGGSQPPKDTWKKEFEDGYIRMLQIRDFTQREKNNIEFVKVSNSTKTCQIDDILIGRYGASVGKICTGLEGAYNVALMKTIPNEIKLYKAYLMYILKSTKFQSFINNVGSRAAQAGFNKDDIGDFQIPLPPLATQKKIAAILDAADEHRTKTKALIDQYTALSQSLFLEMFGDPVTNPKGWEVKKLEDVVTISSGSTPSRLNEENYVGTIPWVKTGEVNSKIIYETGESISEEALANSSCKMYPKGSLIIAMYGQGKTRGKVGMLGIDATTNQACAVLRKSDKIDFEYLFNLLKLLYEDLRRLGRGGNQPNLNAGMLKSYSVIYPPITLQNEFAERVQAIEEQKAQAEVSLTQAEELCQSLLQRAFKGELV